MRIEEFTDELNRVLPADLPHRDMLIEKSARHLELIVEANRYFNLTRITSAREAAVKHVLDSVIPRELFGGAKEVLDAGTGAGFPGIPLAIVLPETRFTLAESIGKKARFVESVVARLDLKNVTIAATRAEELASTGAMELITARALAPIAKGLELFGHAIRRGARILLYKGPDVDAEISEAEKTARRIGAKIRVAIRYDLPGSMGSRTMVEITR